MALSDGEKLIITMLSDIHLKLGINESVDASFIRDHVEYDFWAIKRRYPGIFGDGERDPEAVRFVTNALDMWMFVEEGYAALSPEDQELVKASPGAHNSAPRFRGFDGHTDLPSVAHVLVNRLGYWQMFADRGDFDSHSPDTEVHQRMLEAFNTIRPKLDGRNLSVGELQEVLAARIHPDNR